MCGVRILWSEDLASSQEAVRVAAVPEPWTSPEQPAPLCRRKAPAPTIVQEDVRAALPHQGAVHVLLNPEAVVPARTPDLDRPAAKQAIVSVAAQRRPAVAQDDGALLGSVVPARISPAQEPSQEDHLRTSWRAAWLRAAPSGG